MADTGYRFATQSTASSSVWVTTPSFFNSDGVDAQCNVTNKNITSVHMLGNFGFTTSVIPDNSVINTVNLRSVWRVTTTGGIATLGMAVAISGTLVTTVVNTEEPTSLSTQNWDITGATTWAAANFRNGTLVVMPKAFTGNNATNPGFRYDSVSLDVIYTPPAEAAAQIIMGVCNLDGCGSDGRLPGNALE